MPATIKVFVVGGDEGFVWWTSCSTGNMLAWKATVKSPYFNVCGIVGISVLELHSGWRGIE